MRAGFAEFAHYPSDAEIDAWCASVWALANATECRVELLQRDDFGPGAGVNHSHYENSYIRFSPQGMDGFYGYWQPAASAAAPLLVHVPGYGHEMSAHPELVAMGFHVLHISPLGYMTPMGPDESKRPGGSWPVLPETVTSGAEAGYRNWLANCISAITWVQSLPDVVADRVSFFGTSQGGGASILLGSIFRDRGVRCVAADVPFLTNYPMAAGRGAYQHATKGLDAVEDTAAGWKSLGYADTISHARRLTVPTLLTAGALDETCPPETIQSLYEELPGTKSITHVADLGHRYSREFVPLAAAWFRLYG
jgi:cephalosporin-C deacetylase-like acetyl esterase